MIAAGDWPANGLVYCNVPVRLSNADTLASKLMLASTRTIYTMGDFNTKAKKGASLMTKQRIYHLSGVWSDAFSTTSKTGRRNTSIMRRLSTVSRCRSTTGSTANGDHVRSE